MFAVAQIGSDVVRHSLVQDDYGAFASRAVDQLDGPFDFAVAAVVKLKAVVVERAQIRQDALDFVAEPAVGDVVTAHGPDSNEIAVDLSVYLMHFVGHLNEERVQDAVNDSVDAPAVAVDEQPDSNGFEIVSELDVICDSAAFGPSDFDSVDSDDSNVAAADFAHLANADWAPPNSTNVDSSAAPIGYVRTIHAEVVDSIDAVALPLTTHTIHTAIDWSVELGGLPDTSDAQLLGCNAVERVVAGLAVDLTLRSLAVGASVLAGWEIAFSVDLVGDTRKCVADSQPAIGIDVASVVRLADVHMPCQQPDMGQLVHWPAFPIHPNRRDHLIHRVDHPWSTYCPQVIGMMDIVAAVVAMDVGHGVARTRQVVPLVVERLHRIGSMHH